MQLQIVIPDYVHGVWSKVEQFFDAAYAASSGDCTVSQRKLLLIQGAEALLVFTEGEEIVGAMSVKISNHPDARVAFITAFGGCDVVDTYAQVEQWAASQGAVRIRFLAREAQARLYRQKLGFATDTYMMERTIQGVAQ